MKNLKNPDTESSVYKKWLAVNTVGLFIIFAASMLAPAFPFYWTSFSKYIYNFLAIALIVLYLIFRRGEKRTEAVLCALFCIWLLISRFLNGDLRLTDGEFVLNIAVSCMFFPVCMLLDEKRRSQLLDVFSLAVCLFFTFGAVLGLYTAVTQKLIINPFSQWYFCEIVGNRLYMFTQNPNAVGNWMYICLALLGYQFAKRKNVVLRVLIVLVFIIDFGAATIADSRNAMLGISVGAGAVALLLSLKYLPLKKQSLRALTAAVIVAAVIPLTYLSFSQVRAVISSAALGYAESAAVEETESSAPSEESAGTEETEALPETAEEQLPPEDNTITEDTRGFADSGRIPIYKSAFYSLKLEPMRLIRGSLSSETMAITNEYLPYPPYGHYHNSLLHVLESAGLPGFVLELAFLILLVIRAVKLFFTEDRRATAAVKMLVAALPGFYIYNMLESSIFCTMDFRSIAFFLIAGAVTAYSYEICPPKNKKA